jgi:hypothetical protein
MQAGHLSGPRVVRLDTTAAYPDSRYLDERLLRLRMSPTDSSFSRLTHWAPYARGDSVYAVLGDGFTGVELRLLRRGDTLIGTGYTLTDVRLALTRSGPVIGSRFQCGALNPQSEPASPAA